MAIDRKKLVNRHNPILEQIDYLSPLTVGNGNFAYTADVTGMQSLYEEYAQNGVPLCTMSNWGWHTQPEKGEKSTYTLQDVELTEYDYQNRKVYYAVDKKRGSEKAYDWLRNNPHRANLARIGLLYHNAPIKPEQISNIRQSLNLYEGLIISQFKIDGEKYQIQTVCDGESDALGFHIEHDSKSAKKIEVILEFPYPSCGINGSDWEAAKMHKTIVYAQNERQFLIERIIDDLHFYTLIHTEEEAELANVGTHSFILCAKGHQLSFSIIFEEEKPNKELSFKDICNSSFNKWEKYWKSGGIIDFYKAKDNRAKELERRMVLSLYLTGVQSCGTLPPQETGLTCNSWGGKFHLEMYLWHCAFFPLWNKEEYIKDSLKWYQAILPKAKDNAKKNGFQGARWPKQVAYDGIDSPSPIATLLIWQQPHIIYLLELCYQCKKDRAFLQKNWELIRETALFMLDYVCFNEDTKRYDLPGPFIPAQEEHDPVKTKNSSFELEYWSVTLKIAANWAKRMEISDDFAIRCLEVADNMANPSVKDGCYLAHENCPDTFGAFSKDHPSMVAAMGLLPGTMLNSEFMKNTLEKVYQCWDFDSMWGWDFGMMAMSEVRIGRIDKAIDILLRDAKKNQYMTNGHNYQTAGLPLYLPGNGAFLLALGMIAAGVTGNKYQTGFPNNGLWEIEIEDVNPFPY